MMKKLLKQITILAIVLIATNAFGQTNIRFDETPTTINDDATLDNPIITTFK